MNKIMNEGRGRNFDVLFAKDNVREMLRQLARQPVVWYASDQSYDGKGSALLPFFGEPAMTNTAISRIAKASGATVLPYFCRRLPDDSSYVMSIGAPLDGLAERRRERRHAAPYAADRGLHPALSRSSTGGSTSASRAALRRSGSLRARHSRPRDARSPRQHAMEQELSLARFWAPRYWPTWVLLGSCTALARLPFPWQLAIGRGARHARSDA